MRAIWLILHLFLLFVAAKTPPNIKHPPASPRCRAGLKTFTSRLHTTPPSGKRTGKRNLDQVLDQVLDPATDPEMARIPRVTATNLPGGGNNQIAVLNPVENHLNLLGPLRSVLLPASETAPDRVAFVHYVSVEATPTDLKI